jgi:hypothetical protein
MEIILKISSTTLASGTLKKKGDKMKGENPCVDALPKSMHRGKPRILTIPLKLFNLK